MSKRLYRLLQCGIMLFFVILTAGSAVQESLTFDEIFNLEEGMTNLTKREFPIEPYNPPLIRELASIPTVLGLIPSEGTPSQRYLLNRLVIVSLASILLWQVMEVSRRYIGQVSSLASGLVLAMEPTFLAHSHYITPDIGVTLFVFLAYIAFLEAISSPTMTKFFFFGVFFGLALASKVSALPFLVVSFLFVFFLKRNIWQIEWYVYHAGNFVFSVFVAGFIVWATYFFRFAPVLVSHENPERLSNKLLAFAEDRKLDMVKQGILWLQGTPVPLGDYIGILKNNVLRARESQPVFHMGMFHPSADPLMMLQIALVKLPFPLILLCVLGFFMTVVSEKHRLVLTTMMRAVFAKKYPSQNEPQSSEMARRFPEYKLTIREHRVRDPEYRYLFIIPIVAIIVTASLVRMQPLIRYILPAFPFLAIVAGYPFQHIRSKWKMSLLFGMIAWMGYSLYTVYPHSISFTNTLVPQTERYRYLFDSNIDWGQGLISFQRYIEKTTPSKLYFSYFGRDDGSAYGFESDRAWGSHKNDEICAFHTIRYPDHRGESITAISVTNWYQCGYYKLPRYDRNRIQTIVADSILIFE